MNVNDLYEWYMLGYAITDGYWRTRNIIRFKNSLKDITIHYFLRNNLKCNVKRFKLEEYKNKPYHVIITTIVIIDNIKNKMLKIGWMNKVKENNIFDLSQLNNIEFLHFLLGMIDGDGCVDKNRIRIVGILNQLFQEIQNRLLDMFKTYNFKNNKPVTLESRSKNVKCLYIHKEMSILLSKELPINIFNHFKHIKIKQIQNEKFFNKEVVNYVIR